MMPPLNAPAPASRWPATPLGGPHGGARSPRGGPRGGQGSYLPVRPLAADVAAGGPPGTAPVLGGAPWQVPLEVQIPVRHRERSLENLPRCFSPPPMPVVSARASSPPPMIPSALFPSAGSPPATNRSSSSIGLPLQRVDSMLSHRGLPPGPPLDLVFVGPPPSGGPMAAAPAPPRHGRCSRSHSPIRPPPGVQAPRPTPR